MIYLGFLRISPGSESDKSVSFALSRDTIFDDESLLQRAELRELVLQNLGKVDKTQDELFDEFLNNFAKQQVTAAKLQKYLHGYIQVLRLYYTISVDGNWT